MTLMCVTGELGAGKTLTLTYLAWLNHFKKQKKIYSNYTLYGIPHTKIWALDQLDKMRDGFFAADELWLWLDSRCSRTQKQTVVSDILLKSRKRGITYCFSSQTIGQLDTRIKKIIDFTIYPVMNASGTVTKAMIFQGPNPQMASKMKQIYFLCEPVYRLYDTQEEIPPLAEYSGNEELKEILLPPRELDKSKRVM